MAEGRSRHGSVFQCQFKPVSLGANFAFVRVADLAGCL